MLTVTPLTYDTAALKKLCEQFHVRRLAVFGSQASGTASATRDLDLLVEFDAGKGPGWDMFLLEERLADLFGRKVDLNTPGFISKYFREEVLRTAQDVYAS